jgi:carbamoyl-phosphate synthase small subunit
LRAHGIVGIAMPGTRALTRHLRDRGAMRGAISTKETDPQALLARILESPSMMGADLAREVSTPHPYVVAAHGEKRFTVAALDLGIKAMTPYRLAERGCEVHVLPATATAAEILGLGTDGVFFSNGPGDPAAADYAVAAMRGILDSRTPVFGICFGNQILGRALGRSTYKMVFGHRGINVPVMDHVTGRVAVTAQNHGFALEGEAGEEFDTPFGRAVVSHTCANDGVVEGIKLVDGRAFSVQYHPEAAAGPHDANYLFDQFVDLISEVKAGKGNR